jgi:hypothetical protein
MNTYLGAQSPTLLRIVVDFGRVVAFAPETTTDYGGGGAENSIRSLIDRYQILVVCSPRSGCH